MFIIHLFASFSKHLRFFFFFTYPYTVFLYLFIIIYYCFKINVDLCCHPTVFVGWAHPRLSKTWGWPARNFALSRQAWGLNMAELSTEWATVILVILTYLMNPYDICLKSNAVLEFSRLVFRIIVFKKISKQRWYILNCFFFLLFLLCFWLILEHILS